MCRNISVLQRKSRKHYCWHAEMQKCIFMVFLWAKKRHGRKTIETVLVAKEKPVRMAIYGGCERKNNKIRWLRKGRERFYAFPRLFADFMEGLRLLCLPQQIIKAGFCSGINFLQVVLASAQHLALILVRPTRCAGFTASQESRPNAGPRQAQAAESWSPHKNQNALIICFGKHKNLKPSIKSAKSLGNA